MPWWKIGSKRHGKRMHVLSKKEIKAGCLSSEVSFREAVGYILALNVSRAQPVDKTKPFLLKPTLMHFPLTGSKDCSLERSFNSSPAVATSSSKPLLGELRSGELGIGEKQRGCQKDATDTGKHRH